MSTENEPSTSIGVVRKLEQARPPVWRVVHRSTRAVANDAQPSPETVTLASFVIGCGVTRTVPVFGAPMLRNAIGAEWTSTGLPSTEATTLQEFGAAQLNGSPSRGVRVMKIVVVARKSPSPFAAPFPGRS